MAIYDPAKRRRSVRKGRERGVWIFVPGVELEAAGITEAEDGGTPFYRVWTRKRAVLVQLYARP